MNPPVPTTARDCALEIAPLLMVRPEPSANVAPVMVAPLVMLLLERFNVPFMINPARLPTLVRDEAVTFEANVAPVNPLAATLVAVEALPVSAPTNEVAVMVPPLVMLL